jgi:putative DNA primase/helicase
VVTGDRLPARGCHQRTVTRFRPQALHLFAGNKLPPFKGGFDRGVKRRLAVIEFNRVIPVEERIDAIGLRIASEEADLLLAWALGAAEHILTKRLHAEPPCSEALVEEWCQTDAVLAWITDRVLPPPGPPSGTKRREPAPPAGNSSTTSAHGMRLRKEGRLT